MQLMSAGAGGTTPTQTHPGGSHWACGCHRRRQRWCQCLGRSQPAFGALRIMPIERLNSILVVTPERYLDEARRWIEAPGSAPATTALGSSSFTRCRTSMPATLPLCWAAFLAMVTPDQCRGQLRCGSGFDQRHWLQFGPARKRF